MSAYIKDEFENISIESWQTNRGERFFDPLRKTFLPVTPEELVRQRMIAYLVNRLDVPEHYLHSEEHLVHYGLSENGRMDVVIMASGEDNTEHPLAVVECKKESVMIEAKQVIDQALNYARLVKAKYFILVNGVDIQFYLLKESEYIPIEGVLSYSDMLKENFIYQKPYEPFMRLDYSAYDDVESLKEEPWYHSKIGADTEDSKVPFIINLDDCLLDMSCELESIKCHDFSLIKDLGTQFRQYNDASGGGFGTGTYRCLLVEDKRIKETFLIGFSIIATGKTVNDPIYGNTDGKSVLVIMVNDGDTDEMSAQINMNRFLKTEEKRATISHNGAVKRKGASKEDLFEYIRERTGGFIIQGGQIGFGELDYSKPLTMKDSDVRLFISRLIEYSIYRNEYKKSLTVRKKR